MKPKKTDLRAYGVIVQDGRVLLCRLGANSLDPGIWTLPGGGGEYGESPEETCIREIWEETGFHAALEPRPLVLSRLWDNPDGFVHSVRFIYRASIVSGELRIEEDGSTDHAEWVPLEAVADLRQADIVGIGVEAFGI